MQPWQAHPHKVDVLLTTFLTAALAEWGDRTQLLILALAVRFGKPLPILGGVAIGALANGLIASVGGSFIHDMITVRAVSLLVALSLVFAGVAGLITKKTPDLGTNWKTGPLVTSAVCFFLVEFGDKTQFLTGALAAQYDSILLASLGATLGVLAANAPAAVMRERMVMALPLKSLRYGIAVLFLFAGFITAVNALRLV